MRLKIMAAIALAACLFIFALQLPVQAASLPEPTSYNNVTVWVNPEYDRSQQVLVMIEGQISGADAPATVRFLVPTTAEMYSAGSKDSSGQYHNPYGSPGRTPSSVTGYDEVSFRIDYPTFRMEYYDTTALSGLADKKAAIDLRWLVPVVSLTVIVQEPKNSSDYAIQPAGTTGTDAEGFKIHTYTYTNVSVTDPPIHYAISYTRTDLNPSVSNPSLQKSPPLTGTQRTLIILGAVIGAVVIGTGIWIFLSRKKAGHLPGRTGRSARRFNTKNSQANPASSRPSSPAARVPAKNRQPGAHQPETDKPVERPARAAAKETALSGRYCDQCGQLVGKSFKYCPTCGNSLED